MSQNNLDVLFISPSNAQGIYQDLSKEYAGIEPPTWACMLAESCRSIGYKVDILDTAVAGLTHSEICDVIRDKNPALICFVVYGQNVNAGTTMMSGAVELSNWIKNSYIDIPIAYIGSHVQALPTQTLANESSIDIAFTNEGVYALRNLLSYEDYMSHLPEIKGIAYRTKYNIKINTPEQLVPKDRMAFH